MRVLIRVIALALGVLSAPVAPSAEQPARVPRIGILSLFPPSNYRFGVFRQGLHDLGYAEGKNVAIEYRSAEGEPDRLPGLAMRTTPIVAIGNDLVEVGHAAGLARPGGNITGVLTSSSDLSAKRVELLKEIDPRASRVAVLWNSANRVMALDFRETERGARALGLTLRSLAIRDANDVERAFTTAIKERADALIVLNDIFLNFHATRIVDLAARSRLPAVYGSNDWVQAGGLLSYGASIAGLYRRAATYVDKILKGAKPAELPIEQPTNFELAINLKTARALGLTVPRSLLVRADEIIR